MIITKVFRLSKWSLFEEDLSSIFLIHSDWSFDPFLNSISTIHLQTIFIQFTPFKTHLMLYQLYPVTRHDIMSSIIYNCFSIHFGSVRYSRGPNSWTSPSKLSVGFIIVGSNENKSDFVFRKFLIRKHSRKCSVT